MRKKTYKELDHLAVRLAHRKSVNLDALSVSDKIYVTLAANRLDLVGSGGLAQELRFLGAEHLLNLIERWAEGGDPCRYNLENPRLLD